MHRNAIRSAGLSKNPSKSSNRFRPAYNLFRRKRGRHLLCAVPEDYPVPGFIDGQGWAFAGKVGELSTAPLGFERKAAEAVAPLTGFYLFSAFEVGPDKRLGRPVRCAA